MNMITIVRTVSRAKDGQSRFIGASDIVCQADAGTADSAAGHGEGGDKTIKSHCSF